MNIFQNLAAKSAAFAVALTLSVGVTSIPAQAGIPVIDATNLTQNIMTALEEVAQTAKQIQEYETQLQQYKNMLLNTESAASNIWPQAQSTIQNLISATDTLNAYKNQYGSLSAYLNHYQDLAYYKQSPCFTSAGCTAAQWQQMQQDEALASQAQMKANAASLTGLDQQQQQIQADAQQLQSLQSSATGAQGRMAAIQYGNQLAGAQANQLLQIRQLLITQQQAVATRQAAENAQAARIAAGDAQARQYQFRPTKNPQTWPPKNW
ncbi:MAG: P-type conjugative transfer protein TrbJ [Halothiobacillus sp.]|nr:P-type conjugative transfer protein TrbJ [Halothiobacillus sp.]